MPISKDNPGLVKAQYSALAGGVLPGDHDGVRRDPYGGMDPHAPADAQPGAHAGGAERTHMLAPFVAVAFTAWSLAPFPYGDGYTQAHVAF